MSATSRLLLAALVLSPGLAARGDNPPTRDEALAAMRSATRFYRGLAAHGGYVYHYELDTDRRWGEGEATRDQAWVQPPGTPTVGLAYLAAWRATGERPYLDAATEAARALVYGQLKSGGWTNCIDFDPKGTRVALYRNGRGRGKDNSSLDDGQSQSAIRLLVRVDEALNFEDEAIHEAATVALDALHAAQFPCGGFPQVWTGPVGKRPIRIARFPEHDWRTEGRIKEYWNEYTLNDNVPGYVTEALIAAHEVYGGERHLAAIRRLGDFLVLAQLPAPQPGWAQQYNADMEPIWARRFEPAAVAGDETQEAVETLLRIHAVTGDAKYLEPIGEALDYLAESRLEDGRLARFYELRTNRPLYMHRKGREYTLTYDDTNLPDHYGWKIDARVDALRKRFERHRAGEPVTAGVRRTSSSRAAEIINALDERGRWISVAKGEKLVGQPKIAPGARYVASSVFAESLEALAAYVAATEK